MSKVYRLQTEGNHSVEFTAYIHAVSNARSKQEEDEVVQRDLSKLRKSFENGDINGCLLKESVMRVLYAEMLGHSADFAHINCLNLSASSNLLLKRTGYLATWLTVSPQRDVMILIVSNLLRDMNSSNFLDVACALTAASKLMRRDLISAISPEVVKLVGHSAPLVRKKAVMALHAFYRNTLDLVDHKDLFLRALADSNPAVEAAALSPLLDIIRSNSEVCHGIADTFIRVLEKVVSRRLPEEYDYNHVAGPWFQIKVMQILALLVADDCQLAARCECVLTEVMTRADIDTVIGYAVICEAIKTITSIPILPSLIELSLEFISKMFASGNVNLRYAAIQALSNIGHLDVGYVRMHQNDVLECLEDDDEVIRRRTTFLLLSMCNVDNAPVIVDKLMKYLSKQSDKYVRQELTERICETVERFGTGTPWHVDTVNELLFCASEHVPRSAVQGVLKTIAEGKGLGDEASDIAFRARCVKGYFDLVSYSKRKLPDYLCLMAAWVIGEYGFLATGINRSHLVDGLCDLFRTTECAEARECVIMALMKITACSGDSFDSVRELIDLFKNSRTATTQQRCYELERLSQMLPLMKRVLPSDGCCEEIMVDESLNFLSHFTQKALRAGAKPYEKRTVCRKVKVEVPFCIERYEAPQVKVTEAETARDIRNVEVSPPQPTIHPRVRRWGAVVPTASAVPNTDWNSESCDRKVASLSPNAARSRSNSDEFRDGSAQQPGLPLGGSQPIATGKHTRNKKLLNEIFEARSQHKGSHPQSQQVADLFEAVGGGDVMKPVENNEPALNLHIEHVKKVSTIGITLLLVCSATINDVVVKVVPPTNCIIQIMSCSIDAVKLINNNTIILGTLLVDKPLKVGIQLLPSGIPHDKLVKVEAIYRHPTFDGVDKVSTVSASLKLEVNDFLRPSASMTTEQFGETWLRYKGEYFMTLRTTVELTPQSLGQLLIENAAFQTVEVIGNELIVAASLLGVDELVLGHAVIADLYSASVTIRAQDKLLSEFVARSLTAPTSEM